MGEEKEEVLLKIYLFIYFNFLCMDALSACISVHDMVADPVARREYQIP